MALSFSVFLFALLKLYFRTPMTVYRINFQFRCSGVGLAIQCYFCLAGHRRELPWFRPSDSVEVYLRIYIYISATYRFYCPLQLWPMC